MNNKSLPLLLLWLWPSLYVRAATIRGYVVNGKGAPLGEAMVEVANPYLPIGTVMSYIKADAKGYFYKTGIEPGFYMVYASKKSEHYGDTQAALFGAGLIIPEITVVRPDEVITVKVNLGSPGAVLQGLLLDDQTNEPIADVNLKMALQSDSEKFISFGSGNDGKFETVVPSHPITFSATKKGYQLSTTMLFLRPDEQKTLTLKLKSSKQRAKGEIQPAVWNLFINFAKTFHFVSITYLVYGSNCNLRHSIF